MLFCIGALMLNPALFKLTKPTGGLGHTWFQIITRFLLCFAEDDRPCLDGLCFNICIEPWLLLPTRAEVNGRVPSWGGVICLFGQMYRNSLYGTVVIPIKTKKDITLWSNYIALLQLHCTVFNYIKLHVPSA